MAAAFCFLSHLLALNTSNHLLVLSIIQFIAGPPSNIQTNLFIDLTPPSSGSLNRTYKFMALTVVVSDFIAPSIVDDDNNVVGKFSYKTIKAIKLAVSVLRSRACVCVCLQDNQIRIGGNAYTQRICSRDFNLYIHVYV